ncbi:MAG TPA: hypothetical protein VFE02_18880 [Candidatus Acidoferrales bacterium]|jgi:hypothetical protein|nr:hypothetical protein [Candidatus Acidoferrales bacterium]
MTDTSTTPPFGQSDPTDGREPLDWRTKYSDPSAKRGILVETVYVGGLLLFVPIAMLVLWLEYPKNWLHLNDQKYAIVLRYGFAWLSGVLGGTLYDTKWLYHSVARQTWHMDRRIWRLFTPHISGGLAFAVVALIASGLVQVFDARAVESYQKVVGVAFLVGYFSDSAIAKLSEIAETLFGTSRSKEKHSPTAKAND